MELALTDGLKAEAVRITWYRRNDYPRILQVMADADALPPTYEAWEKLAKQIERNAAMRLPVIRVELRPEKFVTWCAARGLNVDNDARLRFTADPETWPDPQ